MVTGVNDNIISEVRHVLSCSEESHKSTPAPQHIMFQLKTRKNDMGLIISKKSVPSQKKIKKRKKPHLDMDNLPHHLKHINVMAAGIDIGSQSHFVAIPEGIAEESVREFKSFTSDLYLLVDWLEVCGISTVAMESTGVYWIPLYELLETRGFEVYLVDARHVKNVDGRKSDVLDCQWLQQLHTYGLLKAAFRPDEETCILRSYVRQRGMLINSASTHVQHMQKALSQMNIQLHNVLSDITGETGMQIIRAIVNGERNPEVLASYRNYRCKNSLEVIKESLIGTYREEHLFALQQALELYDTYQNKIAACDKAIEKKLSRFQAAEPSITYQESASVPQKKKSKNAPQFNLQDYLIRMVGVDLSGIPGIDSYTALKILSEIGLDVSRWKSDKHFASWLGLCPGNKISGGKLLSGRSKRSKNYAASALRMAASTLHHSHSALGAYYRRLKYRIGAPKATRATAHKLALIIYNMMKDKSEYVDLGGEYYERQYQQKLLKNLSIRAKKLGFELVEINEKSTN